MKQQAEYLSSAPITTQKEADEIMDFVALSYQPTLGFDRNIYTERALSKQYLTQMDSVAFRVASKGFDVKPMTILDDVRFCQLVDSTHFNRADRMAPLFGLPFPYWTRSFTEDAIKRVEDCDGEWSSKKAKGIAEYYPSILRASQQMAAKIEKGQVETALLKDIKDRVAEIESLPNTADVYFSTGGYENFLDLELPDRSSRELRDAVGQLRSTVRERQSTSMAVVKQFIVEKLVFPESQYMADDWQEQASYDAPRCALPEIPSDADYTLKGIHRDACSMAISTASKQRAQAKCEITKSESGLSHEELKTVLRINTGGNSLFDLPDMELGDFFCRYNSRSKITWEEKGLFSTSYKLKAQLHSDKNLSTTATFKVADDGEGLVPVKIEHSVGGNLSEMALQDRMICLVAPDKSWCAQK